MTKIKITYYNAEEEIINSRIRSAKDADKLLTWLERETDYVFRVVEVIEAPSSHIARKLWDAIEEADHRMTLLKDLYDTYTFADAKTCMGRVRKDYKNVVRVYLDEYFVDGEGWKKVEGTVPFNKGVYFNLKKDGITHINLRVENRHLGCDMVSYPDYPLSAFEDCHYDLEPSGQIDLNQNIRDWEEVAVCGDWALIRIQFPNTAFYREYDRRFGSDEARCIGVRAIKKSKRWHNVVPDQSGLNEW